MKNYMKKNKRFVVRKEFVVIKVISYLSFYLIRFVILFARNFCFCFAGNFTVGFAIGGIEYKNTDVNVGFSK